MMDRRRALMASSGVVLPPVPSGYITNGLVFFLDGKQLATATKWTDIVGGKSFALTDCTLTANGVVFNGSTSVGVMPGQISTDWENETIEVVFTGADKTTSPDYTIYTRAILCQPYMNDSVGISCRFGNYDDVRCAIGLDGVQRAIRHYPKRGDNVTYAHLIGLNTNLLIYNKTSKTASSNTSYSKNTTGDTVLGRSATSVTTGSLNGIIHAVRIYNRKLSQAEIIANQNNDLSYYGLSI